MIPTGESIIYSSNKFEPYKLFHNCPKTNVLNKDSNFKNYDEILKNQLMKKKEKYSIDCPLCKAKVMPFRIDFTNVVFVCVNQECSFPFTENVKDFQCGRKELKKKSIQIKEKLYKNQINKDEKSTKLEESKTTLTEDSLSFT